MGRVKFRGKDFKKGNFRSDLDNHLITINSILNVDYTTKTKEEFKQVLDKIPYFNSLLISRSKCDSEEHYQKVLDIANMSLTLAIIDRRMGFVKPYDIEKQYA